MNPAARHLMIRASAGSGKTFALTNRFVGLLAHGAAPEKIVALTFTRKAAGEFFDEILNKLARAASEPAFAKKLAAEIGRPGWTTKEFLGLLRKVVDAMPVLRLGTLDGFFARIARSFPLELGLGGKFELLEEHGVRMERARVLRQMFAHRGGLDDAQKEFVESFKRATFGREEKRLGAQLDAFLDDHQEKFLSAPAGELWGNLRKIWPEGNHWLAKKPDVAAALRILRRWLEESGQPEKQRQRWQDFFVEVETWRPGAPPAKQLSYVLDKALAAKEDLGRGATTLKFDTKPQALGADAAGALAEIATYLVGGELSRRLEVTQGIHAVLKSYEQSYDESVRRAGKLTFSDVQRLLLPGRAPVLTGEAVAGNGRLFIDYRLDAEIDHWLLDEFQDTSVGQWSVLSNLVDEAVQDPTGERSFFCVGDVKQAIFTWREGDPRLFQEILDHYNETQPGTIAEGNLVDSWRSGPALIEMVNSIFGRKDVIAELFSPLVAQRWNKEWNDHHSAVPERNGQAALLLADDEISRRKILLALLQEIRPLERGLSCAVLVQKNSTAAELADFLRKNELPALAESDLHVGTDNPVGALLLALVQIAAHPGDTLAWEHVQMTPLAQLLKEAGVETPSGLAERLLTQIHAHGFEQVVETWWGRLEPVLDPKDGFSRLRAQQFAEAARIFDETGSRDTAEFAAFMERYTVRDAETASVIRVMTIHKSKGLGFDIVMLPDLEGRKLDQRRDGLAVQKNRSREVEWILDLPNKLFREHDPVLSEHVVEAEAEAGYEALSLLYVAMTRAKRAMYAVIEPVGDSKSLNYPQVLTAALGAPSKKILIGSLALEGVWSAGDSQWHAILNAGAVPPLDLWKPPQVQIDEVRRAVRHSARRPSDGKRGTINAAPLFALAEGGAADFGAQVHELLAGVEWFEPQDLKLWEARWMTSGIDPQAAGAALGCLCTSKMAAMWKRPDGTDHVEVWREKPFEIVLDGVWFTGIFDRVIVKRDMSGSVVEAWVIDFKTDRVAGNQMEAAAVKHAGQLNLYRRVASVLTGLPMATVRCTLVMTAGPAMIDVPISA